MAKELIKNKIIFPLGSYKLFFILILMVAGMYYSNIKWLVPHYEESVGRKASLLIKMQNDRMLISSSRYIEIMSAFTKVQTMNLWVHKMKLEGNEIFLTLRSLNYDEIEDYLNSIVEFAKVQIITVKIKNKEQIQIEEEEEEQEKPPVPFAVALFLKDKGINSLEDNNEEDDENSSIFYNFEAEVVLSAKNL
ncbi:MAG: hypothetical protein HRU35_00510 [Rickettsiaceae bacterium]|nr:hypothetical protein [Rickettsiaceae bacterium]